MTLHCRAMKVICAPDSFKESISAADAAEAMACGVRRAMPDAVTDLCPVADGGEGTVEALVVATGGSLRQTVVMGPLGASHAQVNATWGTLNPKSESGRASEPGRVGPDPTASSPPRRMAVIEMASAAGLALVPVAQRDPRHTTTFGVGQLIRAAMDDGATRLIVGIGGSATNDGGCGAAQACGVRFFDEVDRLIDEPITGGDLLRIERIEMTSRITRLDKVGITIACDVTNPLTGPDGAAATYGPQKGASPEVVAQLDDGLRHLASLIRRDVGIDIETTPGAGAAGGLGGGMLAFFGASLSSGIELVLDAVRFDARVADTDLCLTGEGRLDGQSLSGKACLGVARAAAVHGVPTVALVGATGPNADRALDAGLSRIITIGAGLSAAESMRRADELIEAVAGRVVAGREW